MQNTQAILEALEKIHEAFKEANEKTTGDLLYIRARIETIETTQKYDYNRAVCALNLLREQLTDRKTMQNDEKETIQSNTAILEALDKLNEDMLYIHAHIETVEANQKYDYTGAMYALKLLRDRLDVTN